MKILRSKDSDDKLNKIVDGHITMTYVRIPNTNTPKRGDRYGQNLEPAGEYMSMDTLRGSSKIPGYEYGTITFDNPLVIEWKSTGPTGWKKDLSDRYGGKTGKKLSAAIMKDGYDAVMTKDGNDFAEIVNLCGKKQSLPEDFKSETDRLNHFDRHAKALKPPAESPEEYEKRANDIAMNARCYPIGTDHEWWMYISKDGKTVKYNTKTGEFCAYKRIAAKDNRTGYDSGKNIEISSYYIKPYDQVVNQLNKDYRATPLGAHKRASDKDVADHRQFLIDHALTD